MSQGIHQQLDVLADRVEQAAVYLDGPRLDEAMRALTGFATRLRSQPADTDLWQHLRERVVQILSLCRFVQDLLRELVTGERELTSYAETGRLAARASGCSVVHRYG
jgi:hypothetical protein